MDKKYCACGCGEEVKVWNNGRFSPFRRGHHMRKQGYDYYAELKEDKFCKCGCGTLIKPLNNGFVKDYVKGHHLKGTKLDFDYRIERTIKRWGKEPILSPYLEEVFVSYDKKRNRWGACLRTKEGKVRNVLHAKAVYEHYFGEVPKGYVVHHKNGKCKELYDDRPENLMLLLDRWNLRFFPTLSQGFDIPEEIVTNLYLEIDLKDKTDEDIFLELCEKIIQKARNK